MYQALYRKYRPKTFQDVVGQEHITTTLCRQIEGNRLSHAYLFMGTRGTGKTTCAKLLAQAVNCEHPVKGSPCNCCKSCVGIQNGSILDVLELDAASNNGVEHVRALREEAIYAPTAAKKRVYIIDEVHMLSNPAFNALLKIMEEPPEHLLFILATTELHKVPATIKSRCQQFSFRRLLPAEIAAQLQNVSTLEHIRLSMDAAAYLARLADGGMRDALSLLDQCAAYSDTVDVPQVLSALGLAGNQETIALVDRIARRDITAVLKTVGNLYDSGKEMRALLNELSALFRDLLVYKISGDAGSALLTGGYDIASLSGLGEAFTQQRLVQQLSILQQTLSTLGSGSRPRTDAELCMVRLCDETLHTDTTGILSRLERLEQHGSLPAGHGAPLVPAGEKEKERAKAPLHSGVGPSFVPTPAPDKSAKEEKEAKVPSSPASGQGPSPTSNVWQGVLARIRGQLVMEYAFLSNPSHVLSEYANGVLTLRVLNQTAKGILDKPPVLQALQQACSSITGCETRVLLKDGDTKGQTTAAVGTDPWGDLLAFARTQNNFTIME